MIQLQIIGKEGARLQTLVRTAIHEGRIKAFQVVQIKGGLKIRHNKYLGSIKFFQKKDILFTTLKCKNKQKEWQLLESFIGRLTYHFKDNMTVINIQFE